MFELEWRGRRVALKASNGRYVCMKKNGQLAAISDFVGKVKGGTAQQTLSPPGKDEEFILKLINRPILVLRGLDGFVCHRRGSNQLDTNRSVYDVFHLSFSDGAYQIRGTRRTGWARGMGRDGQVDAPPTPSPPTGRGGGFWYTGSHGSVCSDGERPEDFLFEFRERGRLAIRARSGKYLRGGASGLLRADADAPAGPALWEY
ncbi:Fascin-2 [Saguinus oedipus]|uniref:Fascin-2 n=1 Tax=Saguinus oedipus TaxID=9490 RepID=A0ABQ9VT41_SAGOE|nr:Fascin-2 [Saguinus oedipus]